MFCSVSVLAIAEGCARRVTRLTGPVLDPVMPVLAEALGLLLTGTSLVTFLRGSWPGGV